MSQLYRVRVHFSQDKFTDTSPHGTISSWQSRNSLRVSHHWSNVYSWSSSKPIKGYYRFLHTDLCQAHLNYIGLLSLSCSTLKRCGVSVRRRCLSQLALLDQLHLLETAFDSYALIGPLKTREVPKNLITQTLSQSNLCKLLKLHTNITHLTYRR